MGWHVGVIPIGEPVTTPTIDGGTYFGHDWNTQSRFNNLSASVLGGTATAGHLLLVAVAVSAGDSSSTSLTPTVTDTQGNTYTEVTTGWQGVSTGTQAWARVSLFWAFASATGSNDWTLQVGSSTNGAISCAMTVFGVSGANASPIGTSGANQVTTHAASPGDTYNLTATTGATPAATSLMIAILSNAWNGNDSGDPSSVTDDAAFTLFDHIHVGSTAGNGWSDIGMRVSTNSAGHNSCGWTNIPTDPAQTSAPEVGVGLLVEIKS